MYQSIKDELAVSMAQASGLNHVSWQVQKQFCQMYKDNFTMDYDIIKS